MHETFLRIWCLTWSEVLNLLVEVHVCPCFLENCSFVQSWNKTWGSILSHKLPRGTVKCLYWSKGVFIVFKDSVTQLPALTHVSRHRLDLLWHSSALHVTMTSIWGILEEPMSFLHPAPELVWWSSCGTTRDERSCRPAPPTPQP